MRNEILKKIQEKGLAILKLHEKLNELNIEHEFINRKLEKDNMLGFTDYICDFDYQIYVEEDGNRISLIQSGFSYGITENLIEVYNFEHEPIILDHEMAAVLIQKKKLNSYIIACYERKAEELEKLREVLQVLAERED